MQKYFCVVLSLFVSASAWAQARPSIGTAPLQIDPTPALVKVTAGLRQAYGQTLAQQKNAILPSLAEMELVAKKLNRNDLSESNEGLAQLATKAETLYGLFVSVSLTEGAAANRELVVAGRVVRNDAKLMGTASVRQKAGEDPLPETAKILFGRLLSDLALQQLAPTKEESKPVEVKPIETKPIEPKPVEVKPAEVKQVEVKVTPPVDAGVPTIPVEPAPSKAPAFVIAGIGSAVAIGGGVLMGIGAGTAGTAQNGALDLNGKSSVDAVKQYKDAQTLHTIGIVGLSAGAVVAAAGLVWAALMPSAPVHASIVPTADGSMFSVWGVLP